MEPDFKSLTASSADSHTFPFLATAGWPTMVAGLGYISKLENPAKTEPSGVRLLMSIPLALVLRHRLELVWSEATRAVELKTFRERAAATLDRRRKVEAWRDMLSVRRVFCFLGCMCGYGCAFLQYKCSNE